MKTPEKTMFESRQKQYFSQRFNDPEARKGSFLIHEDKVFVRPKGGRLGDLGHGKRGYASLFVAKEDPKEKRVVKEEIPTLVEEEIDGKKVTKALYKSKNGFIRGAKNNKEVYGRGEFIGDQKSLSEPGREVMDWHPGVPLSKVSLKNRDYKQFIDLCIAVMSGFRDKLHKKNLVHSDIVWGNFLVNIENGNIVVRPLDLDGARKEGVMMGKRSGTHQYAPETKDAGPATIALDIYGLGWTLTKAHCKYFSEDERTTGDYLLRNLFTKMQAKVPEDRPSLDVIIQQLEQLQEASYLRKEFACEWITHRLSEAEFIHFIETITFFDEGNEPEEISPEQLGRTLNVLAPGHFESFFGLMPAIYYRDSIQPISPRFTLLESILSEKHALDELLHKLSDDKKNEFIKFFTSELFKKHKTFDAVLKVMDEYGRNTDGYLRLIHQINIKYQSYEEGQIARACFKGSARGKLAAAKALVNTCGLFRCLKETPPEYRKLYKSGKLGEIAKRAFGCARRRGFGI